MKTEDFLFDLEDIILQREQPCLKNDILSDYKEWDSLSKIAVKAYFMKKFSIKLYSKDIDNAKNVADLINLAGGKIND